MPSSSQLPVPIFARQHEIVTDHFRELDVHLSDVHNGTVKKKFGVKDFAERLHIHPTYLSNTIKLLTGRSSCQVFGERLCEVAKPLLRDTSRSIAAVTLITAYDPSNFTKFFKRYSGVTPRQFRELFYLKTLDMKCAHAVPFNHTPKAHHEPKS